MNKRTIRTICFWAVLVLFCGRLAHGQAASMASHDEAAKWADKTLAGLTLEKKIGQMICAEIAGGYIADDDKRLEGWIKLAKDLGVGGFVLYGGTPHDVVRLLNRLQKEAALPLLMSADFEGGPGQQITGATEYPANMAFAAAGSEKLMYEAAKIGAIEGRAIGIHLTYSPVVDIAVRPENPAESVRSFGGDLDRRPHWERSSRPLSRASRATRSDPTWTRPFMRGPGRISLERTSSSSPSLFRATD
jgi:beta-N-acetylhexosaminidase